MDQKGGKMNINYLLLKSCLLWQLEKNFSSVIEENQALGGKGLNGLKYHFDPPFETITPQSFGPSTNGTEKLVLPMLFSG